MKRFAVGIMSGTSGDGISVVMASFEGRKFRILDYRTCPYDRTISKKIQNPTLLKTAEISALDFQLGRHFADLALKILRKNKLSSRRVSVIGSHGHTIFHSPEDRIPSTFQIGEPSIIAEKTGISVVSDFRTADMAAGGQGAPLIPFFDDYFFGNGSVRALQNIGGIGNVTVVGKVVSKPVAFDTGPGNCLIDWAVRNISNGKRSYDANGEMAKKGKVCIEIVREMASHSYFRKPPPKSTGKELFNENFLPVSLMRILRNHPEDALNTITYFTAFTIAESYKRFVFPYFKLDELIVSGGGVFNRTLMNHLRSLLSSMKINSIEKFGIHPQSKEPLAFAFFALRAIQGEINHCPTGTGAHRAMILGKITPGINFKGIRS